MSSISGILSIDLSLSNEFFSSSYISLVSSLREIKRPCGCRCFSLVRKESNSCTSFSVFDGLNFFNFSSIKTAFYLITMLPDFAMSIISLTRNSTHSSSLSFFTKEKVKPTTRLYLLTWFNFRQFSTKKVPHGSMSLVCFVLIDIACIIQKYKYLTNEPSLSLEHFFHVTRIECITMYLPYLSTEG